VIHANDPFVYRIGSLAAGLCRIPAVCHIHHPGQTSQSLRWSFRRRPRLVLTPSLFMKDQIAKCIAGQQIPLEGLWNQIDTDWFRPSDDVKALRARLGLSLDHKHVCIIGALTPHKGHECFLKMASLILKDIPLTSFHIVGGESPAHKGYKASLVRLADSLGISKQVNFCGFVPDELARDLLCASDLFVLPTREEGFGLSIAEAQACHVPVLSTDMPPLDEVVDKGRTGFLLDANDHQAFASRGIDLLKDEAARTRMAQAGRDWVVQRFSRKTHMHRITSLYRGILAGC
jgi:L-malate glycosyltransferase